MALNDDIALLSMVPLFRDISEDKLRLIAFGAERRKMQAGQMLFREGTPADCAFVVAGGRFELSRTGKDGRPVSLGYAERGTLLGELAMVTSVNRSMTAIAPDNAEVIRINRRCSGACWKNIQTSPASSGNGLTRTWRRSVPIWARYPDGLPADAS